MSPEIVFSPTDFVAFLNQTLEFAYPSVVIEGELADFRVSRNRWVYFSLKDDLASVKFFGSVYGLPGPLEDGIKLRVVGSPRLHQQYGFSVNFTNIQPVGEGSIKKAADLLRAKLDAEGLFAPERKRALPSLPKRIGLITAANSAAAADFRKILNERWAGVEVLLADVPVQGETAGPAIVSALNYFEQTNPMADLLVITRGGGSADDLAVFNDERIVRAVAGSRTPTLVAIGHENDVSLAELAADQRASTPTNAAQLAVPDKRQVVKELKQLEADFGRQLVQRVREQQAGLELLRQNLKTGLELLISDGRRRLSERQKLIRLFDPLTALKRGYAIVSRGSQHITHKSQIKKADRLSIELSDGKISAIAE